MPYEIEVTGTGWMVCKVDGCHTTVRSKWGTLCNKHYFRGRRTGTTADREKRGPSITSHGYLARNFKDHPAASPRGLLYEHRRVFFEAFGPNGHSCYWCGEKLTWGGAGKGKIHIDHMNGNKKDNRIGNLKAACHRCNVSRGLFMSWLSRHKDDPIINEMFSTTVNPTLCR